MKIRMRSDLLLIQREQDIESSWVVKDPISFEHFLFSARELFLLRQLDGTRTEDEIVSNWQAAFKTRSLTVEQLRKFVRRVIQDRLVVVEQLGYGQAIGNQQLKQSAMIRTHWWANPLAIRFRGFNPSVLLRRLNWVGGILFHPVIVCLVILASFLVFIYAFGHFEDVVAKLPAIEQLLNAQGLIGLVLTISIVKVLHELGHALVCRRFGGECLEIGVILLAMIPTLYCNVSDAWTFQERWKRLLVSFAGMYVEIILATVTAVLWLSTPPSLLNAMLFNVMVLCSINTLLVNGNPLLRYDGYYMLMDWWEKPDLGRRANEAVSELWLSCLFEPYNTRQTFDWVLVYGLLSFVYRWFVLVVILAGIAVMIGRAGSYPIGYTVAAVLLFTMLATAMKRSCQMIRGRQFVGWSMVRTACSLALLVGVGWFVWCVPLSCFVYCAASVEQADPIRVYAASDGQLVDVARNDDEVNPGDEIARIENPLLTKNLEVNYRQIEQHIEQLSALNRRINQEPELVARIGTLEEKIASLKNERTILSDSIRELVVVATSNGVVLPARANRTRMLDDQIGSQSQDSRQWEGHVNAAKNIGCYVSRGQHLLTIGSLENQVVSLLVGESDMGMIEVGQEVQVRFEMLPNTMMAGRVSKIQRQEIKLNQELIDSGVISTEMMFIDAGGTSQLLQSPFRVELEMANSSAQAFTGSSGRAKISVRDQTVAERISRLIGRSLATQR